METVIYEIINKSSPINFTIKVTRVQYDAEKSALHLTLILGEDKIILTKLFTDSQIWQTIGVAKQMASNLEEVFKYGYIDVK